MIRLKEGVSLRDVSPQISIALCSANDACAHFERECVVTSCNDSSHSKRSLHFTGSAVDLRIRHLSDDEDEKMDIAKKIVAMLSVALGKEFDVVLESDHIHLEYDPRWRW